MVLGSQEGEEALLRRRSWLSSTHVEPIFSQGGLRGHSINALESIVRGDKVFMLAYFIFIEAIPNNGIAYIVV